MLLDGKSALITGAAHRIGAKIARTLHENGANLIIHYRNSATAAATLTADLNRQRAHSVVSLQADLNDIARFSDLVENALRAFGNLDILINNASSFYPTPIGAINQQHWDDLISANFKAPLFLSQACHHHLRNSRGTIINMLDIYASMPLKNHSLYCSAKAANQMLVKSLALEFAPEVRVNGIAPGAILWPKPEDTTTATQQSRLAKIPLQRCGTTESITKTILFLITNDYITGEIIRVDGGRLLENNQEMPYEVLD